MKFINAGFGNYIARDRIISVATPEAAPIKRIIADAKSSGRAIDITSGKKTKSVIITDSDHVIFSALTPEMLLGKTHQEENDSE